MDKAAKSNINDDSPPNPQRDLQSDANFFPRCEYKARFKETSAFKMSNPKHWGTYYRSSKPGGNYDRLKNFKPIKTSKVPRKIADRRASTASSGIFRHPYYLRSISRNTENTRESSFSRANDASDGFLYDQLLKYRCELCHIIVDKFKQVGRKHINVFIQNDFPYVLVQVRSFKEDRGMKNLYQICQAYFIAIANYTAKKESIPIEMVIRASIGHNIPSVSATKKCFRINVGIVPKIYVTSVIVKSLEIFNQKCKNLFDEKLSLAEDEILKINASIKAYNREKVKKSMKKKWKGKNIASPKSVNEWKSSDNIKDLLLKRGDSSGKTIAWQITRMNQYIELLCDWVHNEIMQNFDVLHLTAAPLINILKKLDFKHKLTMIVASDDYLNFGHFEFSTQENKGIKSDNEFWKIINKITTALNMDNIGCKKIYGLYQMLEEANSKFISKCEEHEIEGGYGSDSDGEGRVNEHAKQTIKSYFCKNNKITCYCRKITVQTGMRAINLAYALATCLTETKKPSAEHMYYETLSAINHPVDAISINDLGCEKSKQESIRLIDLNFCANTPSRRSIVNLEKISELSKAAKEEVIVFDYTNATTDKINKIVRLFLPHKKVLMLVNSGTKNEQIGADNNPCGTIRIMSTDLNILKKLYFGLIDYLDSTEVEEKLPKRSSYIRRAYKRIGAVVTNKAIFRKDWTSHNEPMDCL